MRFHFMSRSLFLLLSLLVTSAVAITNRELYELLQSDSVDEEELEIFEKDDLSTSDDEDVLSFPGNADEEVDIEYLLQNVLLDSENIADGNDKGLPIVGKSGCKCRHDMCQCCIRKTWKVRVVFKKFKARLNACLKVEYLPRDFGFRITFKVNGRRLYKKEVSLKHPPSLCFKIPGLGRFARICIELYRVNLRRKRVCARLVGKLNLAFKRFRIRLKLGCFRIPVLGADWLQGVKQGELLEEHYDVMQDDENNPANTVEIFEVTDEEIRDLDDETSEN